MSNDKRGYFVSNASVDPTPAKPKVRRGREQPSGGWGDVAVEVEDEAAERPYFPAGGNPFQGGVFS